MAGVKRHYGLSGFIAAHYLKRSTVREDFNAAFAAFEARHGVKSDPRAPQRRHQDHKHPKK